MRIKQLVDNLCSGKDYVRDIPMRVKVRDGGRTPIHRFDMAESESYDSISNDRKALFLRLLGEDESSMAPETIEVMRRLKDMYMKDGKLDMSQFDSLK